jgi:peroxiredoxin
MLKTALGSMTVFITVFIGGAMHLMASTAPPPEGGTLPAFTLPAPQEPEQRRYLGLPDDAVFTIPDIKAEVVIIELFSMYCPHCQREAPTVNQLYARIEADPKLKDKVKIIGIGIGNSAYEVSHFRKTYAVPFPLFADGDFALHKLLGEVRTPYFIGVRIKDDGGHDVFYSQLGGPQDAGKMLEALLDRSGLRQ